MTTLHVAKKPAGAPVIGDPIVGTTPKDFNLTGGFLNNALESLPNMSTLHLDPTIPWKFGPDGNNKITMPSGKIMKIDGGGATVVIDTQSVITGGILELENLRLDCIGDPKFSRAPGSDSLGYISIEKGALVCRYVSIEKLDETEFTNVRYLVQVNGTTVGPHPDRVTGLGGLVDDLCAFVADGQVTIRCDQAGPLNLTGGNLKVTGTLELDTGIEDGPTFEFCGPSMIDAKQGSIAVNGMIWITGAFDPDSPASEIGNLSVNTLSLTTPAIVVNMGDTETEAEAQTRNMVLNIDHLTLARTPGSTNTQAAIKAVAADGAKTFAAFTDAINVGNIKDRDGNYAEDPNNVLFIGEHVQVGYPSNATENADLYAALTPAPTVGMSDETVRNKVV